VEALAVLFTGKEVAEACGCAGTFAVIDADMKLAGNLIAFGHDQPAATWYATNSMAEGNHIAFVFEP
jgi:hypothetical protein